MKSLFDRTKVYVYADVPDFFAAKWSELADAADGVIVTLDAALTPLDCGCDDLDALCCSVCTAQQKELLLCIPRLEEEEIAQLLLCAARNDCLPRMLFLSSHHKTLDAIKRAASNARISPLCEDYLVRPWIYAAYMGAAALCMDAETILLGADTYGSETVDRAHNANVCIYAEPAEDEDTIRALVRVGCDAVLTHDAVLAKSLVW